MAEPPKAILGLRIWVQHKEKAYLGLGSTVLLKYINEFGSLRKASEALNMSYRQAWGKLKKAEERLGIPLVEKFKGKGQRFRLTPTGKKLVDQFLELFTDVEDYAVKRASELLDMRIQKPFVRGRSTLTDDTITNH